MTVAARIGLIVEEPLLQYQLRALLQGAGYQLIYTLTPDQISAEHLSGDQVHLWLLCLSEYSEHDSLLDQLHSDNDIPVLIEDGSEQWVDEEGPTPRQHRLIKQIEKALPRLLEQPLAGDTSVNPILCKAQQLSQQSSAPVNVWVLGASLGGPEAVCEFLAALPDDLPVAFAYGQHIDPQFNDTLQQAVAKKTSMTSKVLTSGDMLRHGEIGLMPVEQRLKMLPLGQVIVLDEPWPGPFSPSIECLVSQTAELYGGASGCIIFSGMGDDGAKGCETMQQSGGTVLIQSFDSCANSAMPEAALAATNNAFVGSPTQLAEAFAQQFGR
jgi:chemosensory pili system protein ChpB (putative protein-glutamate methylesterase)